MPLSRERNTLTREATLHVQPVAANAKIYQGGIVMISATGFATPGAVATTLRPGGRAEETVDNTGGAAGDKTVTIRRGQFMFKNSGVDPVAQADVGTDCFVVDDETVAKTNGTNTRSRLGKVINVEAGGVWVEIL